MVQATRSALVIHDRVIRSLLSKYRGHEQSAENGTFVLTFDEATDAVAWCLATQQVSCSNVTAAEIMIARSTRQQLAAWPAITSGQHQGFAPFRAWHKHLCHVSSQ